MGSPTRVAKRSPLKRRPLHNPGDSVQRELDDLIESKLFGVVYLAVFVSAMAAYEWWRALTSTPPQPILWTMIALGTVAFTAYRVLKVRTRAASLRLGRDGERAVAQYLEANRPLEWRLFHDICGDGFNVDHVLIAPQGVFVLETKTFSKPSKGEAKVLYDGSKMLVNGHAPDRDPVAQARANRDWVLSTLAETTGRRVPVRGVVVMPGWWIEQPKGGPKPEIWVLNEKALPKFIAHEPVVLPPEDIALLATALTLHATRD